MTHDALGRLVEKASGGSYTQMVYSPTGQAVCFDAGADLWGTAGAVAGGSDGGLLESAIWQFNGVLACGLAGDAAGIQHDDAHAVRGLGGGGVWGAIPRIAAG